MSDDPGVGRTRADTGPRPLPGERKRTRGAAAFRVSPFARLARSHAAGMGGDALVAIALADSLFFSIDPNDARWKVALYLLLTVAPFGIVAPWLGPAMDRLTGGHRYMLIGAASMRVLLAIGMAAYVDSLWLFPLAFSMLVMGKSHHIAKSALVPTTVRDENALVQANSRLSIVSSVSAGLAGIPGVILLTLGGAPWTLGLAALSFGAAALLGLRIPSVRIAESPAGDEEKAEMRGSGIVLAASAMGYVRAVVGFLTMLLAFELRGGIDPGPTGTGVEIGHRVREALGGLRLDLTSGGSPAWHFGLVLVALGLGGLAGALSSPRLRRNFAEERILAGVLALVGLFGLLAALSGGLIGAMMIAFAVSVAGQAGKQSFDAIVQRDAKEANLGRSFARFESRFQLLWVFGAIIPVVLPIPARLGYLVLAGTAGFAAISYWLGRDPSPKSASARRVGGNLKRSMPIKKRKKKPQRIPGGDSDQETAASNLPEPDPNADPTMVMPVVDLINQPATNKPATNTSATNKSALWPGENAGDAPEPPSRPSRRP